MTAYIENLSLINEFMYYLREVIKEQKKEFLSESKNIPSSILSDATNEDNVIGYFLDNRILK
jgi:AAA+ ATPase superfamily predicted ATPase